MAIQNSKRNSSQNFGQNATIGSQNSEASPGTIQQLMQRRNKQQNHDAYQHQ